MNDNALFKDEIDDEKVVILAERLNVGTLEYYFYRSSDADIKPKLGKMIWFA